MIHAIEIENLSKTFRIKESLSIASISKGKFFKNTNADFTALNNINIKIPQGQFYGIIGRNGSGKSTLLRIILGSIKPDPGSNLNVKGKVIKLSMGAGFNNQLSARDNIYINGSILGLSFEEIGNQFHDILKFADVENFVDIPIKKFSSGMKKRLAFSIAIRAEADIILLDEFFGGVGDIEFKEKATTALRDYLTNNKTVILVSHSPALIKKNCQNALWLEKGEQRGTGNAETVVNNYVNFIKKIKHESKSKN